MTVEHATWLVTLASIYLGLGLLFGVFFVLVGAKRIDPVAEGGTWGFRVLILPGAIALWPLLASRWLRGSGAPPDEVNAHRRAAREASE